jgi:hypothetical protein
MPCCAFAAFILGQVLIGFHQVRRFFTGSAASAIEFAPNPATEWSPFAIAAPATRSSSRGWNPSAIAALVAIEIVIAIGAGYHFGFHHSHHHHESMASRTVATRS